MPPIEIWLGFFLWGLFVGVGSFFKPLVHSELHGYSLSSGTIKYEGHEIHPSAHLVKWKFLPVQKGASFWLLSGFGFCSPWRYPYSFCCPQLCWNQQFSSFKCSTQTPRFSAVTSTLQVRLIGEVGVSWRGSVLTQWEENVGDLTEM